jgi:DNA mismatch repair protein MSH6
LSQTDREIQFQGNLSVTTNRLLRNILPMATSWVALRPGIEFYDAETTKDKLADFFGADAISAMAVDGKPALESGLPPAIVEMLDKQLSMEALGGMIFYLESLNIDKDLLSQKSFNVYDPIKKGETMILDGQSLNHLEVRLCRVWSRAVG